MGKTGHSIADHRRPLDLTRSLTNLVVKNALFREQLMTSMAGEATDYPISDNFSCLILLARCTRFWQQVLHIVQPNTLMCWRIESYFISIGTRSRRASRTKPRFLLRPSRSSERWLMKITYGVRSVFRGELLKLGIQVGTTDHPEIVAQWEKIRIIAARPGRPF